MRKRKNAIKDLKKILSKSPKGYIQRYKWVYMSKRGVDYHYVPENEKNTYYPLSKAAVATLLKMGYKMRDK